MLLLLTILAFFAASCSSLPSSDSHAFASTLKARQANSSNSASLQVDLGYSVYEGYYNSTSDLNIWKGIRFAAPPTGSNRWQAPQAPAANRSSTIQANEYQPTCYQGPDASTSINAVNQSLASEDCLFLNIWAPANTSGPLPVLCWIHGGGYGAGSGRQDQSVLINANNNSFIGVTIQYRLAAFGFLSSDELYRNGVVNAGIYDQHFALQWIQSYINLFGGNSSQVTIAGESAGGGSVMLQDMAYGGTQGTSLFKNTISASPYLPMQYGYKDWVPTQSYYAFATLAGCPPSLPYGANQQTIFECLQNADEATLVNASATISQSGNYGTWAFLPVTDGSLIQDRPSTQLQRKKINGLNVLSGNNANEGPGFTPQNITSEDDLVAWLRLTFPMFTEDDIAKTLLYYPSSNASVDLSMPKYATSGYTGATALNVSTAGTGQQQRADNIYAETTFTCPSYWLAEAYTSSLASPNPVYNRKAYKYQYSVPPALHAYDVASYFLPPGGVVSPDFSLAFKRIWGNFITTDNPSIPLDIAVGATATNASSSTAANTTAVDPASAGPPPGAGLAGPEALTNWPPYSLATPYQVNLNQSGGMAMQVNLSAAIGNVTVYGGEGAVNDFGLFNAYAWEGGRGQRCDFWRSVGVVVPE